MDVEKLLAAITEAEQAYVPDEPEDEFDFVIPKDEELHTLRCAHLMCGQNSKCSCTTPTDVARRCEADRRQVERLAEMVKLGEEYYDNPTVWGLVQDSLKDFAASYGITEDA